MKILILGQGGREHALVKSFRQSPLVSQVHVIPGNDGMQREALCHKISVKDHEEIIQFCLRSEIDFVFIGPEEPLVDGLSDRLRERGVLVVGPSQVAAQLEGSKIFAKQFMIAAGVPTARFEIVASVAQALAAAPNFKAPYVLKADGLAAGKGVFICDNLDELKRSCELLFEEKILGDAGKQALLEEHISGYELSYLVLTNGTNYTALPLAQDHKRLHNEQRGPNTGGMGTVAPLSISTDLEHKIKTEIVEASIKRLQDEKMLYRGVLFIGVMVNNNKPYVLEYNVRFGDPETQVILPLIDDDFAVIAKKLAQGEVCPIKYNNLFATCVIAAAPGYPEAAQKGVAILGDILQSTSSSYIISAGVKRTEAGWQTDGGRVLGFVGVGSTLKESQFLAYGIAEKITWDGLQKRTDIGNYLTNPIA